MVLEALGSKIESLAENTAVAVGLKKPRMSKTDQIISGVAVAVFTALTIALLAAGMATATTGLGLAVTLPLVIASQVCMLVAVGILLRAGYKLCKPELEAEWVALKGSLERVRTIKQHRARREKENEEVKAAASVAVSERRERYAVTHNAIADKYSSSRRRL